MPGAPPTPAPAVVSGLFNDALESDYAAWTKVLDQPYAHVSVSADLALCAGYKYIAVGCKASAASSTLSVIAVEEYEFVSSVVPSSNTAYQNPATGGAYWTNYPGQSFGFAPDSMVSLGSADTRDGSSPQRLSWHYDNAANVGGWRCGGSLGLNSNQEFRKMMFCANGANGQPPAAPPPAAAPNGLHNDYAESNFDGWTKALDAPYSHPSVSSDITQCAGKSQIAVGCKQAGSTTLSVVAVDSYDFLMSVQPNQYTAYQNPATGGAYWTNYPGKSLGFAPISTVSLNSADTTDTNSPQRLSWHYDNSNVGGWRCGATVGLNSDTNWNKVIFCN